MKRILPLILFCFLTIGASYSTDFEDASDGVEYNSGIFDGSARCVGNTDHVYDGLKSVRFYFPQNDECFGTKISMNFPDVAVVDGTTETWALMYMYFGGSGDNPSGKDWSWSRYNLGQAAAQKMFRFHKADSYNGNKGYNSIYGTSSGAPRIDLEYTGDVNIFQDDPHVSLASGQWYKIKFYCLYSTDSNVGRVKMWIDDVLKIDEYKMTINDDYSSTPGDISGYKIDFGYVWSYWNGNAPENQYSYLDNLTISFDGDPEAGGADTTDPTLTSSDPTDEATGISLTKDPILTFNLSDNESGIAQASVNLSVGGFTETGDLNFSGDLSNTTCYLTLSDLNISLTNSLVVNWDIGFADVAGNVATTESGNFTATDATASGTVFASGTTGDRDNYTEINSGNWDIFDDSGDNKYRINTTTFSPTPGLGLGEYTLYDLSTYSNFEITASVKSSENLATNLYADYNIVLSHVGEADYAFVMFNSDASSSGVFKVNSPDEPERLDILIAAENLVQDNNYHTVRVRLENQVLTVYQDSVLKMTVDNYAFNTGKVGFGGYNDASLWDDVVVTDLGGSQSSAVPPYIKLGDTKVKPNGVLSKWANS